MQQWGLADRPVFLVYVLCTDEASAQGLDRTFCQRHLCYMYSISDKKDKTTEYAVQSQFSDVKISDNL